MLTTLPPFALFCIVLASLTAGALLGIALFGWWTSRKVRPGRRRGCWRFDWNEESTKRGLVRFLTAGAALVAIKYSPEWAEFILSGGLLIIGLMGMFRTERNEQ